MVGTPDSIAATQAVLTLVCILSGTAGPANTTPEPGDLVVRVVDVIDAALPGVTVTARALRAQETRTIGLVTDAKGQVIFGALTEGLYEIQCELAGLEPDYSAFVRVTKRRPARVVLTMSLGLSDHYRIEEMPVTPLPTMPITPRLE